MSSLNFRSIQSFFISLWKNPIENSLMPFHWWNDEKFQGQKLVLEFRCERKTKCDFGLLYRSKKVFFSSANDMIMMTMRKCPMLLCSHTLTQKYTNSEQTSMNKQNKGGGELSFCVCCHAGWEVESNETKRKRPVNGHKLVENGDGWTANGNISIC